MYSFTLLIILDAILWYALIYYALYCIKNLVNLYISSFILLLLLSAALAACPFVQLILHCCTMMVNKEMDMKTRMQRE